jgi:hypothetical protein
MATGINVRSGAWSVEMMNIRLAIVVIIAGISIGLFLEFMVWRIQAIGVDWVSAHGSCCHRDPVHSGNGVTPRAVSCTGREELITPYRTPRSFS